MDRRKRRWRLALVLGVAVVVLWAAWRIGPDVGGSHRDTECVPGREISRAGDGTITKITRTECRAE